MSSACMVAQSPWTAARGRAALSQSACRRTVSPHRDFAPSLYGLRRACAEDPGATDSSGWIHHAPSVRRKAVEQHEQLPVSTTNVVDAYATLDAGDFVVKRSL